MSALDRGLRRELAKAVRTARKTAEAGARNALTALTVAAAEPDPSLSEEDRALRRQLRAHGRQLGDARHGAEQEVGRLAHEVAYEHWHRMLFARFLAESDLLVEPVHRVPVSLDECRDIARESRRDIWAVAAEYAAEMLPRIFRPDDPSLAVRLPPETQRELERTLAGLPSAVFLADDALGWTYQFWQADQKDEVNRSGVKIGGGELPAVTQLFTEPYMVRFLFHNTVGAWRAGRLLADSPEIAVTAEREDDLRRAVRLEAEGGYDFDFLRFVREPGNGTDDGDVSHRWRPAAGLFDKWPTRAAELRVFDPCCGSGHFLVEGLHLLVRLRMEEEHLPLDDAIRAVLSDNLHGLEIDPRCAQIAAFSVAFAAWKLAAKAIDLPPLRIACSGLAPNATKTQWLALAERIAGAAGSGPRRNLYGTRQTLASSALRHTFETLHSLFADAPTLGSLLDPRQADQSMFTENFDDIRPLLDTVLAAGEPDAERKEQAVAASGIADASSLLVGTYSLVITNVPYLARGKQGAVLRLIGKTRFPISKGDLATMFVERGFRWTKKNGVTAFVAPQNWLFLKGYQKLRQNLLSKHRWRLVARLGPGAFETIGGHIVNVALTVISEDSAERAWQMAGVDVSAPPGQALIPAADKAQVLRGRASSTRYSIQVVPQRHVVANPESIVGWSGHTRGTALGSLAVSSHGIKTADDGRFTRSFWECHTATTESRARGWRLAVASPKGSADYSGYHLALRWRDSLGSFGELPSATISGHGVWRKPGVLIGRMSELPYSLYSGPVFKHTAVVASGLDARTTSALWCFARSKEMAASIRSFNSALAIDSGVVANAWIDIERWKKVATEQYPNGLPEPYSDDPTQWIFHGHPCGSVVWDSETRSTAEGPTRTGDTVLQIAVSRLLGYRWPAERDLAMRLADQQRAWVEQCADLDQFADPDGIACLPRVRGEEPAAERLRRLLVAAYGGEWSPTIEQVLLRASSADGRPAANLDEWLRQRFFAEHCRLFYNRPLVWHIWDGLSDGFHALVNYHRLTGPDGEGRRTLEALTFSYLGDWIDRQRAAEREETAGAEGRLAAAQDLQQQLERILEGEPPFDLFIRWKPIHRQPLGWEPDIDDGVRANIRPFTRARLRWGGRSGAGVLRARPNIHWKKDRGQEPQQLRRQRGDTSQEIRPKMDFPWFWAYPGNDAADECIDFRGGSEFDGNRWNDLHYTLAAKRAARERHEREAQAEAAAGDSTESPRTGDAGERA